MGISPRSLVLTAAIAIALTGSSLYSITAAHAVTPNPERDVASTRASSDDIWIITFAETGLLEYRGDLQSFSRTAPSPGNKLNRNTSAAQRYESYLDAQRNAHKNTIESVLGRSLNVTHSYGITFNGIAAQLTPDEAAAIKGLPGVTAVEPAGIYYLDTYRGPAFIGADQIWSGVSTPSGIGTKGQGVTVGILDGGANSAHPSFANDPSCGFSVTNPKLVAVDCSTASGGICTGSDAEANAGFGHGVHTASTVAGNTIDNTVTPAPSLPDGVSMSGVAPCATIHQYKVCATNSCGGADIAAGISNAIADGVDVINFSISGGTSPWSTTDNDRRFLDAVGSGTFVAASAGNTSPTVTNPVGKVNHRGPWVTSVAASSHDLIVGPGLSLTGPGTPPLTTQNVALNPGSTTPADSTPTWTDKPIKTWETNSLGCTASGGIPAGTFTGAIAVIPRGTCAFTEKVTNAYNAGAEMVVITNNTFGSISMDTTGAPNVPAYSTSQVSGNALIAFINTNPTSSTADVSPIVSADRLGDVLADFSFRGPTPSPLADLTKPDITGPGVDIYAATDPGSGDYEFMSGTSMSGPHVAGSAALVKAVHPDWSPMEIRSALMTTAKTNGFREDESSPWNIDDVGSGRVDVAFAVLAGLTMHETKANFLAANPSGGSINVKTLNIASMRNMACTTSCSWTRKFRNRLSTSGSWTVESITDPKFKVVASPSTFMLAPDAEQTVTFTAYPTASAGSIVFGYVALSEDSAAAPQQHLTVALKGNAGAMRTLGGTASGLTGTGLSLMLNGDSPYSVSTDGPYTFPSELPNGVPYTVTVASQPSGQSCTVANGAGTVANSNITNIDVNCVVAGAFWTVTPSIGNGIGTITPDTPQTVNDGDTTSFALSAGAGYHIDSVGGSCGGNLAGSTFTTATVTGDCSVIANFAINSYTVTASSGGNGSITPATQSVNHDGTASFTVTPAGGYHVVSVSGDTCSVTGSGNSYSAANVQANCAVTATFAIDSYTVTASSGGNGSITPPTQSVNHGDAASFNVMPASGYHVVSVSGDTCSVTGSGSSYSAANIQADCAVTATFEQTTYTVTPSVGSGSGTITPDTPQTVNADDTISFDLTPAAGQVIHSVGGTCGGSLVGDVFTIDPIAANCTVIVNFADVAIFKDGFED